MTHDHEHEHHHHDHDHEGHVHEHDIYSEDGVEPTVVSLAREIEADSFPSSELGRRAERIVRTLVSVFAAKKILIGHIKLQISYGDEGLVFISATSAKNVTVKIEQDLAKSTGHYDLGLTVIVFGMPENHASSLTAGIADGLLGSPV
jgi:hypothetical protein